MLMQTELALQERQVRQTVLDKINIDRSDLVLDHGQMDLFC